MMWYTDRSMRIQRFNFRRTRYRHDETRSTCINPGATEELALMKLLKADLVDPNNILNPGAGPGLND